MNKLKPGQIRFTPLDNRQMDMPPYVNSLTKLPPWFKRISKHPGSLRRCVGTVDMLSAGVTLPMWTNCRFRPDGRGSWEFGADDYSPPANINMIQAFPYESTGSCPVTDVRSIETGQYPKLVNPWRIETAPGWSTIILPAYWEPNSNYTVLPAIVHTDIYHVLNVVLNITTDKPFSIPYGTTIAQLVPFKRDSDFSEILFEDESNFKYVATRGFGMGSIMPQEGTGVPYRKERSRVDKIAEESKKNKGIFSRWRQ